MQELHEVLLVKKPQVFDHQVSVDKVRQKFRSLLQRKDRDHQIALDKAQNFIDQASEKQRQEEKNAAED